MGQVCRLLQILVLLIGAALMAGCPADIPTDPEKGNDGNGGDDNQPPASPHTPYPETNETGQSIRPAFIWQCDDPESDPLTFTIHLTRHHDNHKHEPIVTTDTTSLMTEDLEKHRRYDWYVEADDDHNTPVASATWTFYTGESANNPPLTPFNPDPPDSATNVQSEDVTLSWSCVDPDGDPLVYDVWLEVNNGAGDYVVQNHPDESYNVGRLGTGVDFRWYVVAKDDQGGTASNADAKWRFETEEANNPPLAPSNPFPGDNEADVPLHHFLTWHCSDPDGDPLVYDVWFGPPLSVVLVSEGQSVTTYFPTGLLKEREYEWRIVARDDEGAETTGPFWSFTMANEVFAELQLLRSINNDYGILTYSDMIHARFDGAYAPDGSINPLQPGGVLCSAYPLYWLDYEQIYFYIDPQGDPIIWPASDYVFDVTAGGGVDQDLKVTAVMPACEAYFTSPEVNTSVSLDAGFEVKWTSSCPAAGYVDIYVRNDMGEDVGIHVHTENDGSYTFSPAELAPAAGSFQIYVDLIAEEEELITAPGYNVNSFWRSRISCVRTLYVM